MPYTDHGKYLPAALIYNLQHTVGRIGHYASTLPYLQDLKDRINNAADYPVPSPSSATVPTPNIEQSRCWAIVQPKDGNATPAFIFMADSLGVYSNNSLGPLLDNVFTLVSTLIRRHPEEYDGALHQEIKAMLQRAQAVITRFHESDDVWVVIENIAVIKEVFERGGMA